ncbi:molybdenum cofactor sulfurase 3 [Phlebotomus argentipes]|uniref:molybdenum cofactor sulfurase 3 n=1 Tax=Phlebotomus argentipes TaxID=94469 RepID=UPI0028933BFC|nr:molybdenum cofactor sulfurase 3 [Phlebotomus argentipes]
MTALGEEYSAEEWHNISCEFQRIKDEHYLDHAGATLYSEHQLQACFEDLRSNLYCNPHTSKSTEDLIDQVRYRVLEHFNTDSSKYHVIFTSGTTAALKMVAETFDFDGEKSQFRYLRDSHTSVLGMRELVKTQQIIPMEKEDLLAISERRTPCRLPSSNSNSLIVFPAQCNFNGFKYPLETIECFQHRSLPSDMKDSEWFVCLDAASFVSTNYLDLQKYSPDFVCISFYKIFGYPTGLGALLASKRVENALKKRYYGGGTVKIAMSQINFHEKRDCLHERFEDGTISFISIISLLHGFNTLKRLIPSNAEEGTMQRISRYTFNLAKYLRDRLVNMKHSSGGSVVKLYSDSDYNSSQSQGGIVNFNILHSDGSFVGFAEFACMASIYNIIIRTGCFCNPGACQRHMKLTNEDVKEHYKAGHICGDAYDLINGIPTGSIRVSFGYMTTKTNVDALINMIENCYCRPHKRSVELGMISHMYKRYPMKANDIKLEMICVYPIKSCGAFKVFDKWPLTPCGLKYDREWMIVTEKGVALTQKNNTKMCLIRPVIDQERGKMTLHFPEMECIDVELSIDEDNSEIMQDSSLCQSKVCGDRIKGYDCGEKVAQWLENALDLLGVRLIRKVSSEKRFFRKNGTTNDLPEISLANQAQFLLINTTSVSWLMDKVTDWDDQVDREGLLPNVVDRFRGNIVIKSSKSMEEGAWKMIRIGPNLFKVDGQCTRCQMICIDQQTGEKTTEPLRTIAREFEGKMKFGIYLSQMNDFTKNLHVLSCNDKVEITE